MFHRQYEHCRFRAAFGEDPPPSHYSSTTLPSFAADPMLLLILPPALFSGLKRILPGSLALLHIHRDIDIPVEDEFASFNLLVHCYPIALLPVNESLIRSTQNFRRSAPKSCWQISADAGQKNKIRTSSSS